MFDRSRRKIVAAIMALLMLFLLVTIGVIYLSSIVSISKQNQEMLERYVQTYSLDRLPGEQKPFRDGGGDHKGPPNGPPDTENSGRMKGDRITFQLSTFYSVAIADDGEVLAIDTGRNGVLSEQELTETAQAILETGKSKGQMGMLLYAAKHKEEGYTLVAFMDITLTAGNFGTLLNYTMIAGLIAIVVMLIVAIFLAKRIVAPLEQNDARQKQFISDAGHELKTPISVISTNADLLSRQTGDSQWLSNIRYESQRMQDLITQLLDLSRAETARVPVETLDLSRLVTGEALPFESVAFEHGLTLRTEVEEGISVNGNASQLRQLTSILLDNAASHAEGGEIVLTLRYCCRHAVLSVANAGREIPPEVQAHLFERFYRADEARGSDGNHYGLGLAIAKAIADAHKGSIGVECRKGTVVFTVQLPARKGTASR